MQAKKHSFWEAVISTVVGFLLSLVIQLLVFPMFGVHISMGDQLGILGIFTIASVVRQYILRRIFNWYTGDTADVTLDEMMEDEYAKR